MPPHKFTLTNSYPDSFYMGNKFLIVLNMRIFYHGGDLHETQNKYASEKAFCSHTTVFNVVFF